MVGRKKTQVVYVIGAGLSAGLNFPTIHNLLPKMWPRLKKANLSKELSKVIRFHHPNFNSTKRETYPNIEQLLSEMQANAELFDSSRPAIGNFTSKHLEERQDRLFFELANWFHELHERALNKPPSWLLELVKKMKAEQAIIISFNWDLVLDQLLFGDELSRSSYGIDDSGPAPVLVKPHGSLNWYEQRSGRYLKPTKKFRLVGQGSSKVWAFKPYRAPRSERRRYMPLIVPPVYMKDFQGDLFRHLWQTTVSVLSTASEVKFLGYSLPAADFHARFILRCGFYNQEAGRLLTNGDRAAPTGRAKVTVVDPEPSAFKRIEDMIGWPCEQHRQEIAKWVQCGGIK